MSGLFWFFSDSKSQDNREREREREREGRDREREKEKEFELKTRICILTSSTVNLLWFISLTTKSTFFHRNEQDEKKNLFLKKLH